MLSLIGMPPLAGFFGKLYMFMEALDQEGNQVTRVALIWLVALGLLNSVFSAFYYVRVLKAMFLRDPGRTVLSPASSSIALPIVLATAVVRCWDLSCSLDGNHEGGFDSDALGERPRGRELHRAPPHRVSNT